MNTQYFEYIKNLPINSLGNLSINQDGELVDICNITIFKIPTNAAKKNWSIEKLRSWVTGEIMKKYY